MLLFVGLGNPGRQYERNRHNVGFMAVDAIARRHHFPAERARFQGYASEGRIGDSRVILLKPQTFMNESGRAVGEAARYLKIDLKDILVFHDELDLEPGKVRVKTGGSDAGHNGLRSITAHMGADYRRARIGIGRPAVKALVHSYVLGDFAKADQIWVEALCAAIADNAECLTRNRDADFQNRLHLAMNPTTAQPSP